MSKTKPRKAQPIRIRIDIGDRPFLDVEGTFYIQINNGWHEVRTNPAMFAALGGASPEVVAAMPGESVEYILVDKYIEIGGSVERVNKVPPR
jgi:hypothetical protein